MLTDPSLQCLMYDTPDEHINLLEDLDLRTAVRSIRNRVLLQLQMDDALLPPPNGLSEMEDDEHPMKRPKLEEVKKWGVRPACK